MITPAAPRGLSLGCTEWMVRTRGGVSALPGREHREKFEMDTSKWSRFWFEFSQSFPALSRLFFFLICGIIIAVCLSILGGQGIKIGSYVEIKERINSRVQNCNQLASKFDAAISATKDQISSKNASIAADERKILEWRGAETEPQNAGRLDEIRRGIDDTTKDINSAQEVIDKRTAEIKQQFSDLRSVCEVHFLGIF
jgi:hypothetical protein